MPERAHPDDPIWQRRFRIFPSSALAYLHQRYRSCRPFVSGMRVLDIPCGTGMGFPFLESARELFGVDRDHDAVAFAQDRYGSFHSGGMVGNMMRLPFAAGTFDVVICLEGIEHLTRSNGVAFLSEAARVLRESGVLLLSCPLSIDGQHSGNEYHLYEWSRDELLKTVEVWFRVFREKVLKGPAGPVVLLAARFNESTNPRVPSPRTRYAEAMHRVTVWVSSQWKGTKARYTGSDEPGLLPTCFAVLTEETLGSLRKWDQARRRQTAQTILAYQERESGLFGAYLVRQEDLQWPHTCDLRYVQYQITYLALSALTALGERPSHPLRFAERFLDREFALGWVEGGPWHDPWNHSNRIMFLLRFLVHFAQNGEQPQAWEVYDAVLKDLLLQQDPDTGLWHGFASCDRRTAVYAAYHFFPFMFWRGMLPPFADRIIDTALSIQHSDGLFGAGPGGGACEDLDAIDTLVKFSLVTDHRASDVQAALERAFDRILQIQRFDGGFPNYLAEQRADRRRSLKGRLAQLPGLHTVLSRSIGPAMTYYSGWRETGAERGTSDMWAAWFRPLALNLIASRHPDLGPFPEGSRFHSLPGLGWHDEERVRRCARHPKP
jgi:SAM-dependent methyltransferase